MELQGATTRRAAGRRADVCRRAEVVTPYTQLLIYRKTIKNY
jgi:hypothetical protein